LPAFLFLGIIPYIFSVLTFQPAFNRGPTPRISGDCTMPTVVNGIGTWYYGRQHILKRKGNCPFCQRITNLESYDTTLFFVVFFVPLLPLERKRILDQCASCSKHRLVDLKKWEQAKANDSAALLEQLQADPNNRDNILRALGMALAYQDEPLFNRIAESLAASRTSDLAIQEQLAEGHTYFGHWQEAETALRACLVLDDSDKYRTGLGWTLLKQARPEEARQYFQHILDQKDQESAGNIYWLINGYQA
jgi:tetratricopeptide (TPR) repeat protein